MISARRFIIRMHWHLLGCLAICTLEPIFSYLDLDYLNIMGVRSMTLIIISGFLKMVKIGMSMIVILMVCLGFGIVKQRDEFSKSTINGMWILTFLLLIFILLFLTVDTYVIEKNMHNGIMIILLANIPYSIVVGVFCAWSASALFDTIEYL